LVYTIFLSVIILGKNVIGTFDPIYNKIFFYQWFIITVVPIQHPVLEKEIKNCVLFVSWWNKVYIEPDRFLGLVRLPLAAVNLLEGDVFRFYPMTTMGMSI